MKIKVLYFAQLRDILGAGEEMDVAEGTSAGEVEQMLRRRISSEKMQGLALRKAVNEEWAEDGRILKENDVLVLLPPVSGG